MLVCTSMRACVCDLACGWVSASMRVFLRACVCKQVCVLRACVCVCVCVRACMCVSEQACVHFVV